jgi:hypothetical protein
MRPGDRFGLGASIALEFGPNASEGEKRSVIIQRKPNHVLFAGLLVRLRRVLSETVRRDQAPVNTPGIGCKLPT